MKASRFSLLKAVLTTCVIGFLLYIAYAFNWVIQLENKLIDFRMTHIATPLDLSDIVIVDIDNSSINNLNHWPWPRRYYARLVQQLNDYGAAVIGIDILFDSDSLDPKEDQHFAKALSIHKNVLLSSQKFVEKNNNYSLESWKYPIKLLSNQADSGFINFPYEKNGSVRRAMPLLDAGKVEVKHALDLKLLARFQNQALSSYHQKQARQHLSIANNTFSLLSDASYYINFNAQEHALHVPFYLVLEDRVPDPSVFKDKIVLVGATLQSLNDYFMTPKGIISGVDLHAYSIATLIQNKAVTLVPLKKSVLICLALTVLIAFVSYNASIKRSFVWTLSLLLFYSLIVLTMMHFKHVLMLWAPMLILGGISFFTFALHRFLKEELEKQHIQSIFKQYVSPEVVKTLIKSPEALKLGGQKRDVTIFFSDIRNFTAISEKHDPEAVVEQLNEYLNAMTVCIFKWKGTLDKYIGDEIMCVWGAPIEQDNHAELALRCAWDQLAILKDLQQKWKSENKIIFDIGIGMNSGPAIVGNIGSSVMKDYTVIGDNVNYAARLEGLTRDFSTDTHTCRLIISEDTYQRVKHICKVKSLGEIAVKGKETVSPIYEVLDLSSD